MAKISKYIKLDKDILLEYIYDNNNLLSESYSILVDSKNNRLSYISNSSSITKNIIENQLFQIDGISNKYGLVDTEYYSYLQTKDFASGIPIQYDSVKIHLPISWTFGENLGFYIRVWSYDTINSKTYELTNFFYEVSDPSKTDILDYTSPPILFQEKLWGKNVEVLIPSLNALSHQLVLNQPKPNSINYNLTNGSGLSINAPIFIDFHFIQGKQIINNITTYILGSKIATSVPQAPEFERLGLMVEHSKNGDFFEIYGTYNDTINGFSKFIEDAILNDTRYYVEYNITIFEQNIRGKSTKITLLDSFDEPVEYRPIIKYSTTTAIIDVEMRLIDQVSDSQITRRATYGMLQDEVSKYSLNLMKINLSKAMKPKIYNIKNELDPGLIGGLNAMGRAKIDTTNSNTGTSNGTGTTTTNTITNTVTKVEYIDVPINVPYPVLVDKYNVIARSDSSTIDGKIYWGNEKLEIKINPFDNIILFNIATGTDASPSALDLSKLGTIKLVFKNDSKYIEFPLYTTSNSNNLEIGQVTFNIKESSFGDIKTVYKANNNLFYIVSSNNGINTNLYTGLFKIVDNATSPSPNVPTTTTPTIIIDPTLDNKETAIVTRKLMSANNSPIIAKNGASASSL